MFENQPRNQDELYESLNAEFYKNYDAGYFRDRAIMFAGVLGHQAGFIELLGKGFEAGKIKVSGITDPQDKWIESFAKKEIVINSYHSNENFLRLLIAMSESKECPWLGLVHQNNPKDFKKKVKMLANEELFVGDHAAALVQIFFGRREGFTELSDSEWNKGIEFVRTMVNYIAQDNLNAPDYNVYKHGSALFQTEFGISLADIIKMDKQDTFVYLTNDVKRNKRNRTETHTLSKNFKFMKWEYRFAATYITAQLLDNMVSVGSVRNKIATSAKLHGFHAHNFHEIFDQDISMTTISQKLVESKIEMKPKNPSPV